MFVCLDVHEPLRSSLGEYVLNFPSLIPYIIWYNVANLLCVFNSKNMAVDYATKSLSYSSRTIFNYKVWRKLAWFKWVEKFFHSYDKFSHQCKCVQKWSYQQLMNTNSNYYWDKYSCLQEGIQISQMFPGMWKYATFCLCTNNKANHKFKALTVFLNNKFTLVLITCCVQVRINNLHVQKLPHNYNTVGKP